MKPEPPPITIVDPNAPSTAVGDVLDQEPERWRLSRYQKLLAALTAAIVALLSGAAAEIRHVHHERALDAAAVEDVSLAVAELEESDWGFSGELGVQNNGRLPVHVLAVTLVGEGYGERTQDVEVGPGARRLVQLSTSKNCRPAMLTRDPGSVRVKVRTARGDEVVRTLELPEDAAEELGYGEREMCGYLRPDEALIADIRSAARHGRDVVVTYELANQGIFPLTVVGLGDPYALTAEADLPVVIPKRSFWSGMSKRVRLTVTLRVADCTAVKQALDVEPRLPPLPLRLKNPYVQGTSQLDLLDYYGELDIDDPPPVNALALLRKTCP